MSLIDLECIAGTALSGVNGCSSGRYIIGIAGGPGAGKSALAARLRERINAVAGSDIAQVLPMDGFHRKSDELERLGLTSAKGSPETFDAEGYISVLNRLKRGESLMAPAYSRDLHDVVENAIPLDPSHRIIVTEGNYLFLDSEVWSGIRDIIDLKIFLEVERNVCEKRLLERHMLGGLTEAAALVKIKRVDMENYDLIAQTRRYADKVITG